MKDTERIMILLPERLTLLRSSRRMSIPVDPESFCIYFDNFIHPLRPEWDVVVECTYGGNFGNGWKISAFPEDTDEFPLGIRVYDEWGKLLAEKRTAVELVEKSVRAEPYHLLCLGDSMTHRHIYVDHVAVKLSNLKTVGTRSFNGGTVCHEGRGGWQLTHYVHQYADWWGGASPFVFPVGVNGKDYYGDEAYNNRLKNPDSDSYSLDGYTYEPIRNGQIFHRDGKLYRQDENGAVLVNDHPEWMFSFEKYTERFKVGKVDAVSVLLAANDLQCTTYEEAETRIARFMDELDTVVKSVHAYDPGIAVILCLPVCGAEQHAWGYRGNGSAKQYRLNVMRLCEQMLKKWDHCVNERTFICPARLFVDPQNGFDYEAVSSNPYSNLLALHQCNWVHPNSAGYRQLGDALAAVVEKLRKTR